MRNANYNFGFLQTCNILYKIIQQIFEVFHWELFPQAQTLKFWRSGYEYMTYLGGNFEGQIVLALTGLVLTTFRIFLYCGSTNDVSCLGSFALALFHSRKKCHNLIIMKRITEKKTHRKNSHKYFFYFICSEIAQLPYFLYEV